MFTNMGGARQEPRRFRFAGGCGTALGHGPGTPRPAPRKWPPGSGAGRGAAGRPVGNRETSFSCNRGELLKSGGARGCFVCLLLILRSPELCSPLPQLQQEGSRRAAGAVQQPGPAAEGSRPRGQPGRAGQGRAGSPKRTAELWPPASSEAGRAGEAGEAEHGEVLAFTGSGAGPSSRSGRGSAASGLGSPG